MSIKLKITIILFDMIFLIMNICNFYNKYNSLINNSKNRMMKL